MNTLTIQLEDDVFDKLTEVARLRGTSAEQFAAAVTSTELLEMEAIEALKAAKAEAASSLTREKIAAAFDEIRSLNAEPLPGDEMSDE